MVDKSCIGFDVNRQRRRSTLRLSGYAGHLCLFALPRLAARRHDRIDQLLQDHANRPDSVVVSGNRIIDDLRVSISIDDRDGWNTERRASLTAFCFARVSMIDHRIGQFRHFQNAVEVSAELGRLPD